MKREDMLIALESLLKKAETPEELNFLTSVNVDRVSGLQQEVYELRGQVTGFNVALDKIVEELVYNKLIREKE